VSPAAEHAFDDWMRALEARHLAELQFAEVSRALRALSSAYVERRARLGEGAALSGAGKRAAFALFYGPLHFLIVQHIVKALGLSWDPASAGFDRRVREMTVVDLGCGTGAAGAALGMACAKTPSVVGIDRHPWAVGEAAETYRHFGLPARTRRGDIVAVAWPKPPAAFLAAFTLNEMDDAARHAVMERLLDRDDPVLIVEPLAGQAAPWWSQWRTALAARGGRADEWRFKAELPAIVAKLDRAAGLDHRELTARSLWLDRRGVRL
jgi:methyltransferase family protein